MPTDAPERIQFTCPECGVRIKGDPKRAGAQIACPGCQAAITVPAASEDDDMRHRKRATIGSADFYRIAKWVLVVVGGLLFVSAFADDSAVRSAALAGLACFLGIVSRLAQAEEHYFRGRLRGIILAATFTLGATTMTATEPQEKKADPWTEQVTVKRWVERDKAFINPQEGVNAYRKTVKDKEFIFLSIKACPFEMSPKTEITDKDGNSYRVEKVFSPSMGARQLHIVKAEKKPE